MAALFYHCTSAALYLVGNKIYAGKFLGIDVIALGKGGTAGNPSGYNNNAHRMPTAANEVGGIGVEEQVQDEQRNDKRNDNGNDKGDDSERSLHGRYANIHDDGTLGKQQGGMQESCDEDGAVYGGKLNENESQEQFRDVPHEEREEGDKVERELSKNEKMKIVTHKVETTVMATMDGVLVGNMEMAMV